jgi:hypothetical protein
MIIDCDTHIFARDTIGYMDGPLANKRPDCCSVGMC